MAQDSRKQTGAEACEVESAGGARAIRRRACQGEERALQDAVEAVRNAATRPTAADAVDGQRRRAHAERAPQDPAESSAIGGNAIVNHRPVRPYDAMSELGEAPEELVVLAAREPQAGVEERPEGLEGPGVDQRVVGVGGVAQGAVRVTRPGEEAAALDPLRWR